MKENRWCQRKWSEACVILKTEDVIVNRDCGRTIPDSYTGCPKKMSPCTNHSCALLYLWELN